MTEEHVRDILAYAFEFSEKDSAVVVFDRSCDLAKILAQAYGRVLPQARLIDFEAVSSAQVLEAFDLLPTGSLVVLIQSTSFRLDAFRIRIELFNRGLKVIEHPHLSNMEGPKQILCYLDALAYNPDYFRKTGANLKKHIDRASVGVVESGPGARLVFESGFEVSKLNVGDYREMKNVGGQFPIGEVFTEAKNLEAVNGLARIFAFGDTAFKVNQPPQPITLVVQRGRVEEALNSTAEFDRVLENIRADEGEVWVRELGLGLNRAFTRERMVSDIGSYERMCGIHLSLGAKHAVYKKPNFNRKSAWHHVDVFVVTESVSFDDQVVYHDGAWVASS